MFPLHRLVGIKWDKVLLTENWLMLQSLLLFYLFNIYLFFLLSGYTSSAPACFSDAWWLRILWWRHLPALQQTHWLLSHLATRKIKLVCNVAAPVPYIDAPGSSEVAMDFRYCSHSNREAKTSSTRSGTCHGWEGQAGMMSYILRTGPIAAHHHKTGKCMSSERNLKLHNRAATVPDNKLLFLKLGSTVLNLCQFDGTTGLPDKQCFRVSQ